MSSTARRVAPFDSGPLDDEETTLAADELFAFLEAEEDEAKTRWLGYIG